MPHRLSYSQGRRLQGIRSVSGYPEGTIRVFSGYCTHVHRGIARYSIDDMTSRETIILTVTNSYKIILN